MDFICFATLFMFAYLITLDYIQITDPIIYFTTEELNFVSFGTIPERFNNSIL